MTKDQKKYAARKAKYIDQGICGQCKKQPVVPGKVRCQECAHKAKITGRAQYKRRLAAGICVLCAKMPPVEGKVCCQDCFDSTYQRQRGYAQDNAHKIAEYKLAHGCTDCIHKGPAHTLQFDHVDSTNKLANIALMPFTYSWSWPQIETEIAKCEVVCANCHATRTWDRRHPGTIYSISRSKSHKEHHDYVTDFKLRAGCTDCGYKEHPAALELDHLPQFTKHAKISTLIKGKLETLQNELAKCEVVCANCHAVRTWNRSHPNEVTS